MRTRLRRGTVAHLILLFPQNRIQALAASFDGALMNRLSGLLALSASMPDQRLRCEAVLAVLDARRAYLLDMAIHRYGDWRHAVAPYAETSGEYVAALSQALGRLSENTHETGRRAARHLQAIAFALLVTLGTLMRCGKQASHKRQEARPERQISAAQSFSLACRAAYVPLKLWLGQSACIWASAHPAGLRYAIPFPRSEFPSSPSA